MWPIVVWPGKLLADSNFFILFIYFNKIYIKILCYNNHAHTSLNQSSDSNNTISTSGYRQQIMRQWQRLSAVQMYEMLLEKDSRLVSDLEGHSRSSKMAANDRTTHLPPVSGL